jgi:hypothetical protein
MNMGKDHPWKREAGGPPSFTPSKRNIPNGHDFDPKSLKPMARSLWALGVSLGHALTAYRQFTRMKSSTISPDGLLGGRGYVMGVKDIREKLYSACENLSAISDTLYDEIKAPHWKPKLSQLSTNEREDVERFVDEAKKNIDEGEEQAEEEMDAIEKENDGEGNKREWTPWKWKNEGKDGDGRGSKIPRGEDTAADHLTRKNKLAAVYFPDKLPLSKTAINLDDVLKIKTGLVQELRANSSLPVDTLPGGPRVDHLDRGLQTGPYGSFNEDEETSEPDWNRPLGDEGYDYPSPWDNDLSTRTASVQTSTGCLVRGSASKTPGADTETTKTDACDFGIGANADCGGLEHGPEHPTGKGVWGPAAGLPNDPGAPIHNPASTGGEDVDARLDGLSVFLASYQQGCTCAFLTDANSVLPNDRSDPVARSDYFLGPKGNQVNDASGLPGTQIPAKLTPLRPRPSNDDAFLASDLPGDGIIAPANVENDLMGAGATTENLATDYVRWAPDHRDIEGDFDYRRRNDFVRGASNG